MNEQFHVTKEVGGRKKKDSVHTDAPEHTSQVDT